VTARSIDNQKTIGPRAVKPLKIYKELGVSQQIHKFLLVISICLRGFWKSTSRMGQLTMTYIVIGQVNEVSANITIVLTIDL